MKLTGEMGCTLEIIFLTILEYPDTEVHWSIYEIKIKSIYFYGKYSLNIVCEDLNYLHESLISIETTRVVDLVTLEEGLSLNFEFDITGNTTCNIKCMDSSLRESLSCRFIVDYESLQRFIRELKDHLDLLRNEFKTNN